jgi:hypothetical protein
MKKLRQGRACLRCCGSWCSQGMTFMESPSPSRFWISATGQSGRTCIHFRV